MGDTLTDNYPCTAPDFTRCLTWPLVEFLMVYGSTIAPDAVNQMYLEAWSKRIGLDDRMSGDRIQRPTKSSRKYTLNPSIHPQQKGLKYKQNDKDIVGIDDMRQSMLSKGN